MHFSYPVTHSCHPSIYQAEKVSRHEQTIKFPTANEDDRQFTASLNCQLRFFRPSHTPALGVDLLATHDSTGRPGIASFSLIKRAISTVFSCCIDRVFFAIDFTCIVLITKCRSCRSSFFNMRFLRVGSHNNADTEGCRNGLQEEMTT